MGDMAEDFKALKDWNKDRDQQRRRNAERFLKDNGIEFTIPSIGCYKIKTSNQRTIMFYPKSGKIIWRGFGNDIQHRFENERHEKILKKLREII